MKYKVKSLEKVNDKWRFVISYWEGCICSAQTKEGEIQQERRPTLKEILIAINLTAQSNVFI